MGSGRKSPTTGKDAFFMILVVLKHGDECYLLAIMFRKKGATFQCFNKKFMRLISDTVYETGVEKFENHYNMERVLEKNKVFRK